MKVNEEYKYLVESAKEFQSNFPIPCSSMRNITFCKKMIPGKRIKFKIDSLEFILGDRYCYFVYNRKSKEGIINFNDVQRWSYLVRAHKIIKAKRKGK